MNDDKAPIYMGFTEFKKPCDYGSMRGKLNNND